MDTLTLETLRKHRADIGEEIIPTMTIERLLPLIIAVGRNVAQKIANNDYPYIVTIEVTPPLSAKEAELAKREPQWTLTLRFPQQLTGRHIYGSAATLQEAAMILLSNTITAAFPEDMKTLTP